MRIKDIFIWLAVFVFASGEIAFAGGEMIAVDGYFFKGNVSSFQFTVNDQKNYVCVRGPYCPTSMYISIDPNKNYIFDLYHFVGPYYYTISDSCRNKIINVKPNTGRTIKIVRDNDEIVCSY